MAALSRMPHHPGTRKNVYKGFECPHCGAHIQSAKAALQHKHHNSNGSPPKNSQPINNNNKKGTKGGRRKTRRRRN